MHRLTIILNKCERKKYRDGYIKYLKSLEYEEFENIFSYYSLVMAKLLIKYEKNKISFFSKKWLKFINIKYKWNMLYLIFLKANKKFVNLIIKNLDIKNSKKFELILKINETQNTLDSIISNPIKLSSNPKQEDIIKFNLIIIDSIYTSEKLTKLMDELNNIK
jgi:hypothetical protein